MKLQTCEIMEKIDEKLKKLLEENKIRKRKINRKDQLFRKKTQSE